jgi:hypothetical protein
MNVPVRWRFFQNHAVVIHTWFNLAKQHTTFSYRNAMISEMFQCIHRRVLPEIGKYNNATHLSKNATIFAKGCCIHWGIVVCVQSHFTSIVWLLIVRSLIHGEYIAWIGACLNCTFLKYYLSFKQWTFCRELLHTLRNGVLYAKSFYPCCLQKYFSFTFYREHVAWI